MHLPSSPLTEAFESGQIRIKPGDFINTTSHFRDVMFEVESVMEPSGGSRFWAVTVYTYEKYGARPRTLWINRGQDLRSHLAGEMAIPVLIQKGMRFQAKMGQYDPVYGFAPAGVALRRREA